MRKFVLCAVSLTLVAAAAPAKNADSKAATCDAKYYDYLVGRNLDAAREISGTSDYRVLAQGQNPGTAQPKRITVTVDKQNYIVDVACG